MDRHLQLRLTEWTAVPTIELEVVREMARCLAIIRAGEWPK